jgi:hypothetical protein
MYYDGVNNKIFIGRNKGLGETQTQIVGNLKLQADKWILSSDSTRQRLFFGSNGTTYYQGYGASSLFDRNHEWRNNDGTQKMH